MSHYELSTSDKQAHLDAQLGALQRAANSFDEGFLYDATNMARILRNLLHSGKHPSLLKQLGRDQIHFLDTAATPIAGNLATTLGLVSIVSEVGAQAQYSAKLGDVASAPRKAFEPWWASVVFIDQAQREFSRRDVVMTVADKDGGAHVDERISSDYIALAKGTSLGWQSEQVDGTYAPIQDAVLATTRQVAHEVLCTLVPNYSRTRKDLQAARKIPEITADGRLKFYPSAWRVLERVLSAGSIEKNHTYLMVLEIHSITVGQIRALVGEALGPPLKTIGVHSSELVAFEGKTFGVLGEFTDAEVSILSVRRVRQSAAT